MTSALLDARGKPAEEPPARLLAVGDLFPPDLVRGGATGREVTHLPFAAVTPAVIARLRPEIVLSPLVSPDFDCFDLAEILSACRYAGRYRAVAHRLPDPGLVRREIADRFPALDFDLLLLDRPG